MRKIIGFVCLAGALLGPGCCGYSLFSAREQLGRHVIHTEAFYEKYRTSNLADRVHAAPPELIDYLNRDNAEQGFSEKSQAPALAPEILEDIRGAIAELPEVIQRRLAPKLLAVFVVKDLGGSAYTDTVFSTAHKPIGGFVVLDISVTDRKANEWLSWKENSPFLPESGYGLRAEIESADRDSRRYAIQFILLHEFGHVLSIGESLHPSWNDGAQVAVHSEKFPFFAQSWRSEPPVAPATKWKYASLSDGAMTERAQIHYYQPAKRVFVLSRAEGIYSKLEATRFPTLYSVTNPADDFAETFATYVHEVLLKRRYRITLTKNGKMTKTYAPSWNEPRFQEKRKILESFLNQST